MDGVCNLCHAAVRFVRDHGRGSGIRFETLQSEAGRKLLEAHGLGGRALESLVLIERGVAHTRSDAAFRLCAHLRQPWASARFFRFVPRFLRDPIYDFIAANRYHWFGRRASCELPTADLASSTPDRT